MQKQRDKQFTANKQNLPTEAQPTNFKSQSSSLYLQFNN